LLGINAGVVGDHDLEWGVDTLLQRMAQARYPWLVANLVDSASGRRPDWATPYKMLNAGRFRVAVLGYLTPETNAVLKEGALGGLRVLGPASLAEPLDRARAEHPDHTILLAHEGGECSSDPASGCTGPVIDLARSLDSGSVDLIVAGHSHHLTNTLVNGIRVIETGANGSNAGVIDVVKTLVNSQELRARLVPVFADAIRPDSGMQRLVTAFRQRSDSMMGRTIATLALPAARHGSQYALGNLVADAYRNALRSDFALADGSALYGDLPAGRVSYAQVLSVLPHQDELVRITLTGREIRSLLEEIVAAGSPTIHISGLQVSYDSSKAAGRRVRAVRLPNGREPEDRRRYTLAIDGKLPAAQTRIPSLGRAQPERTGVSDLDALMAYLRRLPQPVTLPDDSRFVAVH
jgi:5'-nucleotidase